MEAVAKRGGLRVRNFSGGGGAPPADAALMMAMGAETVFVGSGIFKSNDPATFAKAIVKATTYWKDAAKVMEACEECGLGEPMRGLDTSKLPEAELTANRGW